MSAAGARLYSGYENCRIDPGRCLRQGRAPCAGRRSIPKRGIQRRSHRIHRSACPRRDHGRDGSRVRAGRCRGGGRCVRHRGRTARPGAHGVVIGQGEVWWADLAPPTGSGPGFRRPVVIVQGDAFNRSRIATIVCVPLTSSLRWAGAPGNALLTSRVTGLPKDSAANVSQVVALDRGVLEQRVGRLPRAKVELLLSGLDVVLGR